MLTAQRWLLTCSVVWCLFAIPLGSQWQPSSQSTRIRFSGYEWIVKDSAGARIGPGSNYFSQDAVSVGPEGLRLKVFEKDGRFVCGEVVTAASFGYGTYRFVVASDVDRLATNLTLGMFTWSDDPGEEGTHKELDIELGRWGDPSNDLAQFVVQPYTRPQNMVRFPMPANAGMSVHSFTWLPRRVQFRSEVRGKVLAEHVVTRGVPVPAGENVRLNLWITQRRVPGSGTREVTIRSFDFVPSNNLR
jgi:hypothetical protein